MLESSDFKGKTFLVTGSSKGIGQAITEDLLQVNASVIGISRSASLTLFTSSSYRGIDFNLFNFSEYSKLVEKLPQFDGVIFSAGINTMIPARNLNIEALRSSQDINLNSPILLTKELLNKRLIKPGGSVIFISSIAHLRPLKSLLAYSIAKAGLIVAAQIFTQENAKTQIRFNVVSPGLVATQMYNNIEHEIGADAQANLAKAAIFGLGQPQDIAGAVRFLLSPGSRWITGTDLIVDGGALCCNI